MTLDEKKIDELLAVVKADVLHYYNIEELALEKIETVEKHLFQAVQNIVAAIKKEI